MKRLEAVITERWTSDFNRQSEIEIAVFAAFGEISYQELPAWEGWTEVTRSDSDSPDGMRSGSTWTETVYVYRPAEARIVATLFGKKKVIAANTAKKYDDPMPPMPTMPTVADMVEIERFYKEYIEHKIHWAKVSLRSKRLVRRNKAFMALGSIAPAPTVQVGVLDKKRVLLVKSIPPQSMPWASEKHLRLEVEEMPLETVASMLATAKANLEKLPPRSSYYLRHLPSLGDIFREGCDLSPVISALEKAAALEKEKAAADALEKAAARAKEKEVATLRKAGKPIPKHLR